MNKTIKLAVFLGIVAAISGLLLGFVNSITEPIIEAKALEAEKANLEIMYPNGEFDVANYKDEDGEYPTDFFYCLAFGQDAKFLNEYGYKGRELTISGRLQQRKYENKKGEKAQIIEIKCNTITLHGKPKTKDGDKKSKGSKKIKGGKD